MSRFYEMMRLKGIAPKVFLLVLICIETLTLSITYAFFRHASGILVETQMTYAREALHKSERDLNTNLQNVRLSMSAILNDARLRLGEYPELEWWMMDSLDYLKPTLHNIHLVSGRDVLASTSSHSWELLSDPVVLQLLSDESRPSQWIGPYISKVSGYTLTYIATTELPNGNPGVLLADINLENLYYSLFANDSSEASGILALLDQEGRPVFGKAPYMEYDYVSKSFDFVNIDPALFRSDWTQTEYFNPDSSGSLIITREQNAILPWQMALIMDKQELLEPLHSSTRYFWWLGAIAFVLSVAMALFITAMISRPIRNITRAVQNVSAGDFEAPIPIDRNDEIGYLALQFKVMIKRIVQLIGDLRTTEEEKKRSDFRALQAQIKPHYLYNTLNAISVLGRSGDAERMDRLISALTNQLHYALDQSPHPVTLGEELASVEHYSELMRIRYPDKFRFVLDIDPVALDCKLPKFILQPLVENAIFHGMASSKRTGTVLIAAMAYEEDWEIWIEDDGAGMHPDTLASLSGTLMATGPTRGVASEKHIGLRNVHERFRFMFGDAYNMNIESEPGKGTRITIKLPRERSHSDENVDSGG